MTNSKKHIGNAMAKGAAWMVGLRFSIRGIGFISTIILARLLLPDDFAIVALAATAVGFLETMSEFRLDNALIQNQNATILHYHTAWTMGLIRAVLVTVLLVLSAKLVAEFFQEPRLSSVIYILAAVSFLDGLQSVKIVNLRKKFEFHKEFVFMLIPKVLSFIATIFAAVMLRNYWALVIGIVVGRFIKTITSYIIAPYRPRLTLNHGREILSFSIWLWFISVIGYLARRLDQILIARYVGTRMLGIYHVAHEIASLPTTELIWPMARAFFPGYAQIESDRNRLVSLYLDIVYTTCLIGFPVAIGLALIADPAVTLFLGEKWIDTIPLIQIIVVYGAIDMTISGIPTVYTATGRPKLAFFHSAFVGSAKILIVFYGVYNYGVYGAAWALVISGILSVAVGLAIGCMVLPLRATDFFARAALPAINTSFMAGCVMFFQHSVASIEIANSNIFLLTGSMLVGGLVYYFSTMGIWILRNRPDGAEKLILEHIKSVSGKFAIWRV